MNFNLVLNKTKQTYLNMVLWFYIVAERCQDFPLPGKHEIYIPEVGLSNVYCGRSAISGFFLKIQELATLDSSFAKTWDEYKNGFESGAGNYWLGLEKLHRLTSRYKRTLLRIDMLYPFTPRRTAVYKTFQVAGESDGYRLYIDEFDPERSNLENAFLTPDAGVFVTQDRDHGKGLSYLAAKQRGGWWANGFNVNNLNAEYPVDNSKADWQWTGLYHIPWSITMHLQL